MKREAKDRVVWMNAKDGAFSIESLYFIIKSTHAILPKCYHLELLGPIKSEFFGTREGPFGIK